MDKKEYYRMFSDAFIAFVKANDLAFLHTSTLDKLVCRSKDAEVNSREARKWADGVGESLTFEAACWRKFIPSILRRIERLEQYADLPPLPSEDAAEPTTTRTETESNVYTAGKNIAEKG